MKLSRYKHSSPVSYAFGATLVYELLQTNPKLLTRVFLRPNIPHGADLDRILAELQQHHVAITESTKVFNVLGAKDSCLLIAEFQKPDAQLNANTNHIVLVNPSDAGNLGTIMRSATAFNFHNLAIITPAVDPYDPKAIRASMGAVFHLNIQQFSDIESYLSKHPHHLYAFILDASATPLSHLKPTAPFALVFVNEASGLPADFRKKTGAQAVYIPQSANVDSLNLSSAVSIALYTLSN